MNSEASIRIGAGRAPVDPMIYGHFLEQAFFGNITGGVFDEGSELAVDDGSALSGCRTDVIDACRELGLPIVRWPGGNFTSAYWWTDGIGPRDDRPRRLELAWGSEEDNRFGTPEFLAWCDAVGTEPYLAHSCRSVDDAVRWVEYTNYGGDTDFSRRRAADGHPAPYGVRYWGLGNEVYGRWQMGHRGVEQYVADATEHARFMSAVDPGLSYIAVGHEQAEWTVPVVEGLGDRVDYVSLHLYGRSRHLVDPSPEEFSAVVAQSAYFEREIRSQSAMIESVRQRRGIERPLRIAMDEWNIRHLEPASWPDPQPGARGGIAERATEGRDLRRTRVSRYSSRTLADALFYGGVFQALQRAASLPVPVGMANTVNLVNANALIEVRPEGLVRSATYHVWDLYQRHTGAVAVPVEVAGPGSIVALRHGDDPDSVTGDFPTTPEQVADLDVSVTASEDRRTLHVAVINRSPDCTITASLSSTEGPLPQRATVRTLGADAEDLFAVNSIDAPGRVRVSEPTSVELPDGRFSFAPHAITVLELAVG